MRQVRTISSHLLSVAAAITPVDAILRTAPCSLCQETRNCVDWNMKITTPWADLGSNGENAPFSPLAWRIFATGWGKTHMEVHSLLWSSIQSENQLHWLCDGWHPRPRKILVRARKVKIEVSQFLNSLKTSHWTQYAAIWLRNTDLGYRRSCPKVS